MADATVTEERGLLHSLRKERVSHAVPRTVGIPVVRQTTEFLTEAQLEWVSGPPNEITIQNPVYLKHKRKQEEEERTPSESALASHEVRGLSENVIPGVSSTNHAGIERLNERRRTKHEACIARAREAIASVAKQLEPRIVDLTQDTKQQLAEYDKERDGFFKQLGDDAWLVNQSASVLDSIRDTLIEQLPQRQAIVEHLDYELEKIERERSSLVTAILDNAARDLEEIAFQLPDAISRWIESEMLDINEVIIRNRKAYAELNARLMKAEVLREAHAMDLWQQRASAWVDLKKQCAIHSFTLLMTGPETLDPPARRRLFEQLNEEQAAHMKRRTDFLRGIAETHPPACNRSTGREWAKTLSQLNDRLEAMHANMMELFREQEQMFRDQITAKFTETVLDLVSSGVFAEEAEARAFMEPIGRPLIAERDSEADRLLYALQGSLDRHREILKDPCSLFVEFGSGAAGLWTEHEVDLRQVETTLQERLERTRSDHDFTNQELEARLDAVMDRMRQDADRDALAGSLQEALQHLDKIERGYHEFQQAAVGVAQLYPMLIRDKLSAYEQKALQFFGLSRKPIVLATMADRLALMQQMQVKPEEQQLPINPKDPRAMLKRRPSKGGGAGSSNNLFATQQQQVPGKKQPVGPPSGRQRMRTPSISIPTTEPDQVEDLTKITTTRGTVYYVVRDFLLLPGDPEIGSAAELLGFAMDPKPDSRPGSAMGKPPATSAVSLTTSAGAASMQALPIVQTTSVTSTTAPPPPSATVVTPPTPAAEGTPQVPSAATPTSAPIAEQPAVEATAAGEGAKEEEKGEIDARAASAADTTSPSPTTPLPAPAEGEDAGLKSASLTVAQDAAQATSPSPSPALEEMPVVSAPTPVENSPAAAAKVTKQQTQSQLQQSQNEGAPAQRSKRTGSRQYNRRPTVDMTAAAKVVPAPEVAPTPIVDDRPPEGLKYLADIALAPETLTRLRRMMRRLFLEHIENWAPFVEERALAAVAAKTEELNNELDLRLHLHGPRANRARMDVHNVRAAELIAHRRRVDEHCAGVLLELDGQRDAFAAMTEEHTEHGKKLKSGMEGYIGQLVLSNTVQAVFALQKDASKLFDSHLRTIRLSLRTFRDQLDTTLTRLRDANVRFRQSFRAFSEGGNYCTAEIQEFRGRLEELDQAIDETESSIASDLGGREIEQMDAASAEMARFEERFRHHAEDLSLLQKEERELGVAMVKVRSEMGIVEADARDVASRLERLEAFCARCKDPNAPWQAKAAAGSADAFGVRRGPPKDAEEQDPFQIGRVTPALFRRLDVIRRAIHRRAVYLDCLQVPVRLHDLDSQLRQIYQFDGPSLGNAEGMDSRSNTVERMREIAMGPEEVLVDASSGIELISMAGSQAQLRAAGGSIDINASGRLSVAGMLPTLEDQSGAMGDGRRSRMQGMNPKLTRGSRANSLSNSSLNSVNLNTGEEDNGAGPKSSRPRNVRKKEQQRNAQQRQQKATAAADEKPKEKSVTYMTRVANILENARRKIFVACDTYFKEKGDRPVLRRDRIDDSREGYLFIINNKLEQIRARTETFRNDALGEFRGQLRRFLKILHQIPEIVYADVLNCVIEMAKTQRQNESVAFDVRWREWGESKRLHRESLRPNLGHPNNRAQLEDLCEREATRWHSAMHGVKSHVSALEELEEHYGEIFLERSQLVTGTLLAMLDSCVFPQDVEVDAGKRKSIKRMLKEAAQDPYDAVQDGRKGAQQAQAQSYPTRTWPGLPLGALTVPTLRAAVAGEAPPPPPPLPPAQVLEGQPGVALPGFSSNYTPTHQAVIATRDETYEKYLAAARESVGKLVQGEQEWISEETRWQQHWVKRVGGLRQSFAI